MRSFLTIFALLVWLPALASASALKGVRGHKRALAPESRLLQKKKCKKYADKEDKDKVDPKAKEAKESPENKAANPKAGDDPKAKDPKVKGEIKEAADKETKEAKLSPKEAKEAECLEYYEEDSDQEGEGSGVESDPPFTSSYSEFDQINVDCDAIANDKGPTDTHSVSFSVNIDVLKDAESTLNSIYDAMEKELQQKVAPRIAGCSSGRFLESGSSTSKIVHVDFGEMEFDHQGCDSSLAKEAAERDGVCMASDVPVDVYFVGDFPENAMAKVEVAIEEHEWGVDGLLDTSEVAIIQTGSTMGSGGSSPEGGMIGGIVAAIAACLCAGCGFAAYKRSRGSNVMAKAELETDEESDDEKNKVAVTTVQARRVG